tara:strand:+ start:6772 stop:6930 length:159 start_codon:yes stop_codon:yes gene_type:complete
MKASVKSTNRYDQAQVDMGFKKVHIWVPIDKVDEVKWQAKLLRDTHKKEAGL